MVPGAEDDDILYAPERVAVRASLESLSQRDRRVVYLRFYLGMTQSEIAEEVGVSQVHVSRILRSALEQLGDELDVGLLDGDGG